MNKKEERIPEDHYAYIKKGRDEIGNQTEGERELLGVERVHDSNGTSYKENHHDNSDSIP